VLPSDFWAVGSAMASRFVNNNHFATLVGASALVSAGLAVSLGRGVAGFAAGAAGMVMSLALVLTRSRGGWLSFAVGAGVFVDRHGAVQAAGGYLIQVLGGLADDEVEAMEAEIAAMPHPTEMLRAGDAPTDILERVFDDRFQLLERKDVRFHCPCDRGRARRALRMLGQDVLLELRRDDAETGYSSVVCEFCRTEYRFGLDEIDRLIDAAA